MEATISFIVNPIIRTIGGLFGGGQSSSPQVIRPATPAGSPAVRPKPVTDTVVLPRTNRQADVRQALLKNVKGGGTGGVAVPPLGNVGGFGGGGAAAPTGYKTLLGG